MEDLYLKELLREDEDEQEEEVTHEQDEYYVNLVSGPYMHIFLENFRREVQKSSSSSKRRGKFKYKGVGGDGIKEEDEEIIEPSKHEPPPTLLPADNLKSAMKKKRSTTSATTSKGQRNKGNKAVTWAPDVYDPHPSADSHYMDVSGGYGSSTSRTEWDGGGEKKINRGKSRQKGADKNDDGEGAKGSKNNAKKTSGKDGIEGGDTASETWIVRGKKSESKKSQKNPKKGVGNEARGGAIRGKEKDKKGAGGGGGIGVGRGGGGDNGGKGMGKKLGKSKGAKA